MGTESDWDQLVAGLSSDTDVTRDKQIALLLAHIRQQRFVADELRAALNALPGRISDAVELGLRRVVEDEEVGRRFWERGYDRLADHATNGVSQWVGKRVLLILVAAALSASIGWAVLTGRIK
jgi:hypothetical protein